MKELEVAIKAAKAAGAVAKAAFYSSKDVKQKGPADIVTDADVQCEDLIKKTILAAFPDHEILAEESGTTGKSDDLWIVDPIDGTINFAYGLPDFSVSIAFARKKEIRLGVLYFPIHDELYVAEKGKGAKLNGKPIHVSRRTRLEEAPILYDASFRKKNEPQMLAFLSKIAPESLSVRMTGAATRDAALLASGRCDAWVIFRTKIWDIAAGVLIMQEAGGRTTDLEGNDWNFGSKNLLASNGKLHDQILRLIR